VIEDPLELPLVEQPGRAGEARLVWVLSGSQSWLRTRAPACLLINPSLAGIPGVLVPNQGVSRARPLARRACKTLRPLRVALRARNPWVLARLMRLGWKVCFIAAIPGRCLGRGPGGAVQKDAEV
jgi:hypothetical protein